MSTECNKSLAECEKKLVYYKEMYGMRTEAYIHLEELYQKTHMYLLMYIKNHEKNIDQKEIAPKG